MGQKGKTKDSMPETAEYGFWKSPITSDLIVAESIPLGQIALSGGDVYWSEGRPSEGGRSVIVRHASNASSNNASSNNASSNDGSTHDASTSDVNPSPLNARTRVHEYGGGAFLVNGSTVYFSNFKDQRLYRAQADAPPAAITPEAPWRYADGVADHLRDRLISVREDHSAAGGEALNTLAAIDLSGDRGMRVLVEGNDFYSNPRVSPDGSQLAWLTWNHPNMPWDGTELWVAEIEVDGRLSHENQIAGGRAESIFQPEWSPNGELYFVSDRSGWWNLYRYRKGAPEVLIEMQAEFGLPQWVFGQSTYAFESADRIICAYTRNGTSQLASIDTARCAIKPIDTPYTHISQVRARAGKAVFRGGAGRLPAGIVEFDLETGEIQVLRRSFELSADVDRYISAPEAIEFPTENGLTAHGFFYAPHNPGYEPPAGELPPLIVKSHGGPTGATSGELSLEIQYWTSRGFAVFDVNYGGSTGYGRAYRERLAGQWGIVDVDDCENGAQYLVEQGRADGDRLIIKGGSAGGYTTLAVLTFRDSFQAGASYYGVGDLEALARDTHKFESRYLDGLVGPYPERTDLYRERSPIHSVEQLNAPVIFFQGSEDKVVPPNQAAMMVEALQNKGLPVSYFLFDGEQHGFRGAETIKRTLDAELYFYAALLLKKGLRF
jgi:dipeptidyl aminopeptidase/acylaminoacyl peptidase